MKTNIIINKSGNSMRSNYLLFTLISTLMLAFLASCVPATSEIAKEEDQDAKQIAVATTTIVGDVVRSVAGEAIEVVVLLPPGTDPHGFEPTPQEIALLSEADVVFANGAGLEEYLEPLIESASVEDKIVFVSDGITLIKSVAEHESEGEDHEYGMGDPHTWSDPNNVMVWVSNIEHALSELDADNAGYYHANAEAYREQLKELDGWIREQVSNVAEEHRRLVTDHQVFAYFAEEYGFIQVGTLLPGYSTMAEPSAQELARIEDTIHELGVKAVFVGNTVNPNLAQRVTEDTGLQLIFIYTGSLSDPGGEAETYLEYIQYNVNAIVDALK